MTMVWFIQRFHQSVFARFEMDKLTAKADNTSGMRVRQHASGGGKCNAEGKVQVSGDCLAATCSFNFRHVTFPRGEDFLLSLHTSPALHTLMNSYKTVLVEGIFFKEVQSHFQIISTALFSAPPLHTHDITHWMDTWIQGTDMISRHYTASHKGKRNRRQQEEENARRGHHTLTGGSNRWL